jgi:hypothetical protein
MIKNESEKVPGHSEFASDDVLNWSEAARGDFDR